MRFRYSSTHIEFLREGYKTHRLPELTRLFNNHFGLDKTESQIKATLKNHKLCVGWPGGNPKGTYRLFTKEQFEWIRDNYTKMSRECLTDAFNLQFTENKTVNQIIAFVKNHKIPSGRTGRFEKGHTSWNDGMAGTGLCKPNSGNFKKGSIPANITPLGTERINKDGFIEIKVPMTNPYTGAKTRYMHKQVWAWEQANGPVPEDHVIRFLDGDKTNCSLDNLALFSRAESLRMTQLGFSDVPVEVKPTVAAMAKLDTKARNLERECR